MNREFWLTEMARMLQPLFKGFTLRPYKVTCGWPLTGAIGQRKRTLGVCFGEGWSTDRFHEIFISPLIADPVEVAGTVCHELAHVAAGIDAKHGPVYKRVARHVGLTRGKATQAMPGLRLTDKIKKLIEVAGPYPHSAMKPVLKAAKPSTSVSVRCGECGCVAVLSAKWIATSGPPTCGCGGSMSPKGGDS